MMRFLRDNAVNGVKVHAKGASVRFERASPRSRKEFRSKVYAISF